jgi:hypothetical protein
MKVTLRQLREGAQLTLAQDLKMEYRLAQRFIRDKDLFEGVRASKSLLEFYFSLRVIASLANGGLCCLKASKNNRPKAWIFLNFYFY